MVRSMGALLWAVFVLVLVYYSTEQYVLWGLRGPLATRDIFVFVIVFFVFVYYSTVQRFIVVACMGSAGSIGNWSYRLSSCRSRPRRVRRVTRSWTGVTSFCLFSYRLCLFLNRCHVSLFVFLSSLSFSPPPVIASSNTKRRGAAVMFL